MSPEEREKREEETNKRFDVVPVHREIAEPKEGEQRKLWPHSVVDDGMDDDTVTDDIVLKTASLETVQGKAPPAKPAAPAPSDGAAAPAQA